MTTATVFDDTICTLGEGPLWHPLRNTLFWFDILGKRLHTRGRHWQFDACVSAAGWVDRDTLLVASEHALMRFDIGTGQSTEICPLEADNPVTRSNDGRADPQGGFWIGTMGFDSEPGAGSIWRFYKGGLRRIFPGITVSNTICFAPDGRTAYFSDSLKKQVMAVALDGDGWPLGAPRVHVDLTDTPHIADGAVVDATGTLWTAQWGSSRIAGYDTRGQEVGSFALPAIQTSCPAFGGPDFATLCCTSAAIGLTGDHEGKTFEIATTLTGQAEHRVLL